MYTAFCVDAFSRLHAYGTAVGAQERIADYVRCFNEERPHQDIDNMTPDDVYYMRKPSPAEGGAIRRNSSPE